MNNMHKLKRTTAFVKITLCLIALITETVTHTLEERLNDIDTLIRQELKKHDHVGLAVGIVDNGRTVFAKGYGLRNNTDPQSHVTNRTIFAIASLTKAFTAYAVDRLVSVDGILDYDDLVTSHIPEFRMSNPYTTMRVKLRDLLSHTTGLPRHDALWQYSNFSRNEFLARLPHLETNYYLRESFQYSNIMYGMTGILIERVSGKSWEQIVRQRIFEPLNMKRTFAHITDVAESEDDVAQPHSIPPDSQDAVTIPWILLTNVAPCGSIVSSVEDMTKWMQTQLQLRGRSTTMHVQKIDIPEQLSQHFDFAYAFGWTLAYHRGRYVVWHNGGVDGFSSYLALFPGEQQGIVMLANLNAAGEFTSNLTYKIADILANYSLAESDRYEWKSHTCAFPSLYRNEVSRKRAHVSKRETGEKVVQPERYVGRFKNPGYGIVKVFHDEFQLYAIYNTIKYALTPKKVPDVFSAESPFPRAFTYECSFARDSIFGHVYGLRFGFEPLVSPIFFEKQVSDDLYSLEYLKSFSGTYGTTEISVNRGRHLLYASQSEATSGELKPIEPNVFWMDRFTFEFVRTNSSVVSELRIHIGEHTMVLKKNGNA